MHSGRSSVRLRYPPLTTTIKKGRGFLSLFCLYHLLCTLGPILYWFQWRTLLQDCIVTTIRGVNLQNGASDWQLVYRENLQTRSEAIKEELEIKRKKSRGYIEDLIKWGWPRASLVHSGRSSVRLRYPPLTTTIKVVVFLSLVLSIHLLCTLGPILYWFSEDIVARGLYRHNNSRSKFTKRASDWQLV